MNESMGSPEIPVVDSAEASESGGFVAVSEPDNAAGENGTSASQATVEDQTRRSPSRTAHTRNADDWMSGIQWLSSTVVLAVFVITFLAQAFQIPSQSMERTLLIGDYLLVDKVHYADGGIWNSLLPYSPISRGDIIVFRYPVQPTQHFVKQIG